MVDVVIGEVKCEMFNMEKYTMWFLKKWNWESVRRNGELNIEEEKRERIT